MTRITSTKPKSKRGTSGADEFSFGSGPVFGDNAKYASENITFDILAVAFEIGKGFEGRNRWAITVKAADRGCEILTLGSNPKRDEELRAVQAHLERGGSITNKRLHRSGNAYYLRDAPR